MSKVRVEFLTELLQGAHDQSLQIAAGVPESHRLKQLQEGKATPLWLMGHLANTINTLVLIYSLKQPSMLTREQSKLFAPDFVGGKTPTTNADDYPSWDEVLELYRAIFAKALKGIGELEDEDLGKPLPGKLADEMRGMFSSIGVTLGIMINHDAYHRGQIGMIAKLD